MNLRFMNFRMAPFNPLFANKIRRRLSITPNNQQEFNWEKATSSELPSHSHQFLRDLNLRHVISNHIINDHDLRSRRQSRRQSRRHRRPLDNNAFDNAFDPPTVAAPAAATNAANAAGAQQATTTAFANLCQLPTHLNPPPPQPQPPLQQPQPTLHQ